MSGPGTVLLVEDLEDLREVLQRALLAQGYRVLSAGDAEEALRLADEPGVTVDLLLTDWQLPLMNGCELARAMVQMNPQLRVLLTSGRLNTASEDLEWLEERGEYLAKPYDLSVMLSALQRLQRPS